MIYIGKYIIHTESMFVAQTVARKLRRRERRGQKEPQKGSVRVLLFLKVFYQVVPGLGSPLAIGTK